MRYASAAVRAPRRPRRAARTLVAAAALLLAAALSVMLLLACARLAALEAECEGLAEEIAALADERARLTIEIESLYPLEEVEEYAENVLGMGRG